MIENSPAGLSLFAPDRQVAGTREEHHQPALQAYAPRADGRPRMVVVELGFAPIPEARHRGRRGIEIRLDGQRVGELTALMSERYGPLVEDVVFLGGRPACIAQVVNGRRGVEVELRLPAVTVGADDPPPPVAPEALPAPPRARRRTPYLVGAGVAALLIVIGASIGRGGDSVVPTVDSASVGAPTTTAAPVPTAAPTSAATAATVRRTTAARSPIPRPAPEPEAAPEPTGGCDPNYGDCLPGADDIDCPDESGDGPAHLSGPVEVDGTDIRDLDPDDDGTGCE